MHFFLLLLLPLTAFSQNASPHHHHQGGGSLGDLHFDKFVCREGEGCEQNPGRQMSWFSLVRGPSIAIGSLRGHSATAVEGGGEVFVVGGVIDKSCSSQVFLLDTVNNLLVKVDYTGTFTARQGHVAFMSLDSKILYIYGGHCNGVHYNDLFALDLETREFSKVETSGKLPPLAEGLKGAVVGKQLVVFGGCNYIPQRTCTNQVFTLHLEMFVWVEHDTKGEIPEGRDGHSVFTDGETFFMFGGRTYETTTNDLYAIVPGVWVWKQLQTTGLTPPPLQGMTFDTVGNKTAFLFGGCRPPYEKIITPRILSNDDEEENTNNNPHTTTTTQPQTAQPNLRNSLLQTAQKTAQKIAQKTAPNSLEGDGNEQNFPSVPPHAMFQAPPRLGTGIRVRLPRENEFCNGKVFSLNLGTLEWEIPRTVGTFPAPRESHAAAVVEKRMIIIGGCQQHHCVSDVYMLDTELHCIENCNTHGDCVGGMCRCHSLFSGVACENDLRCGSDCSLHGVCVNALCVCDSGFGGRDCNRDLRCPMNCSRHGLCKEAVCVCNPPYHGDACQFATNCPNDCGGHGFCNSGYCFCDTGYSGRDCTNRTGAQDFDGSIMTSSPVLGAADTADENTQTFNTTQDGLVFVGPNQGCAGYTTEITNTTLSLCKISCFSTRLCAYVSFVPTRGVCRTHRRSQCKDLWSNFGTQLFIRDPAPVEEEEPTEHRIEKKSRAKIAETTSQERDPPTKSTSSSSSVFLFLGAGVLIGTLFGFVGKTLTRKDYHDEFE